MTAINILGISSYYHDSAAALIRDGDIIAAAQEERFTRIKHDPSFPIHAIQYCLEAGAVSVLDLDYIVFYEKPLVKFERLLETYLGYAPKGFKSFVVSMPAWLKEKLYLKTVIKKEIAKIAKCSINQVPKLLFSEHHQSHAAAAFFPSPFSRAAVICIDAVGEWATTSVWLGENNQLKPMWDLKFPHSLGMLYSAFTYYTGFKVNSGEYKLMGLAPYGEPVYTDLILDKLININADGTFQLNMRYFDFATGLTMTNKHFDQLFGGPPRSPESAICQREMDIAASIQKVTEKIVLQLIGTVHEELQVENLCMAGGVALNCVANGKILKTNRFKDIWIQPASGDAGSAVGAAMAVWYQYLKKTRIPQQTDGMKGAYLGPQYSDNEIFNSLNNLGANFVRFEDDVLFPKVAQLLQEENVIGWFQGRMEFGPRALGGRSIIGDPRSPKMQSVMNQKIKFRESFRPFAPSILADKVSEYFELNTMSPYMLLVAQVREELHLDLTDEQLQLPGIEKIRIPRSTIPAITHVDYSARVQTVHQETNPRYYQLIQEFNTLTGCPMLVNTSFNVRGEPIVCSPEDAYRCFMRTEMDYLVIENYLLSKSEQPTPAQNDKWQEQFILD